MTPGVPCRARGSSCSSRSCCAAAPWTIAGSPNSTSVAPPPSGSRGARARRSSHSSGCSTSWRAAPRRNTGPPMASTPRPPATPPSRNSGVARRSCDRRSVVPRRPPGGTGRAVGGVPGQHRGDPRARSRRLSLPLSPHTGARARWAGRPAPGIRRVCPGRRRRLARHSGRDPLPRRAADPGRGLRRVPLPRGRFERQRARRQRARPGAHTRWVEGRGDHRVPDARRGAATQWIIPGLIDTHVHFSQTGWVDGRPDALDLRDRYPYETVEAELHARPERFFRSYLCSGVTSVFDVGGYPWTLDLQARTARSTTAPRVLAAGPLLSTIDFWLNLPDQRQFIYMADSATVRQAVRAHKAWGAAAMKVWYIMPPQPPDTARVSALVHAAGDEARKVGLPLIVHATGLWEAKDALRAGARVLVHSVWSAPVDDEFLALARSQGTTYVPTLTVPDGYRQVAARRFARDRQPLACVDRATRAKALATDTVALAQRPSDSLLATRTARTARSFAQAQANLKRVHDAGIPIALGTDAGNPLTLHGASVFMELEAMQASGLTAPAPSSLEPRRTWWYWTPIRSPTSATSDRSPWWCAGVRCTRGTSWNTRSSPPPPPPATRPRGPVRMRMSARPIAACGLGILLLALAPAPTGDLRGFTAESAKVQRDWEAKFRAIPSPD